MGLKNWIKRLLGLMPPQPFPPMMPQDNALKTSSKSKLPEGVKMGNWGEDRKLQRVTQSEDGIFWQQTASENALKNEALTDYDRAYLSEKELDELRAMELKVLWAQGLSAKAAADRLDTGHRQIQDYWAVFNKAQKDYAKIRNA